MNINWLSHIENVLPVIPTLLLVWVSYRQWKTGEEQRRQSLIHYYLQNYKTVCDAITLCWKEDRITHEVDALLWQARDQAKLMLDSEIANYTHRLFKIAHHAFYNHPKKQADSITNNQAVEKLRQEQPHEIYQQYVTLR